MCREVWGTALDQWTRSWGPGSHCSHLPSKPGSWCCPSTLPVTLSSASALTAPSPTQPALFLFLPAGDRLLLVLGSSLDPHGWMLRSPPPPPPLIFLRLRGPGKACSWGVGEGGIWFQNQDHRHGSGCPLPTRFLPSCVCHELAPNATEKTRALNLQHRKASPLPRIAPLTVRGP